MIQSKELNSPAAEAVADNHILAGPKVESPGNEPRPDVPLTSNPNIHACCVPLSWTS